MSSANPRLRSARWKRSYSPSVYTSATTSTSSVTRAGRAAGSVLQRPTVAPPRNTTSGSRAPSAAAAASSCATLIAAPRGAHEDAQPPPCAFAHPRAATRPPTQPSPPPPATTSPAPADSDPAARPTAPAPTRGRRPHRWSLVTTGQLIAQRRGSPRRRHPARDRPLPHRVQVPQRVQDELLRRTRDDPLTRRVVDARRREAIQAALDLGVRHAKSLGERADRPRLSLRDDGEQDQDIGRPQHVGAVIMYRYLIQHAAKPYGRCTVEVVAPCPKLPADDPPLESRRAQESPLLRAHSCKSSRALHRTRTDDPFLTMEPEGDFERAREDTSVYEMPAQRDHSQLRLWSE